MLGVIGGLTVMLGSSPLAAQADPSASRALDSTVVAPGGIVTVTISVAAYGVAGQVTEQLPSGFTYVEGSVGSDTPSTLGALRLSEESNASQGTLVFNFSGVPSFYYEVTASSVPGPHTFVGSLTATDQNSYDISGSSIVTVSTGPAPVDAGDGLQFDVVPAKAVKGAVVSGLNHPIGSNPLEWPGADTTATLVSIGADDDDPLVGEVGDFVIKEAGSGKFRLYVDESGAPALLLSGTQAIDVVLTYDDGTTDNLIGDIKAQQRLVVTPPGPFKIPQSIGANTPIGAFDVSGRIIGAVDVSGRISDEYLDGILTGAGSDLFNVRDADMALVYRSGDLEVKTYNLDLTVSGDAGLANRTDSVQVQVTVTASNVAPTAPPEFEKTIKEDETGAGLVMAGSDVGDASAGVSANDGDDLAYTLVGADDVFVIDKDTGMITVGSDGISDSDDTFLHLPNYGF